MLSPTRTSVTPFHIPAAYFAVALGFLGLGGLGLIWIAPDLARGAYPFGRVAGVAHLFTLGWITTVMLGAFYPLLPVTLGRRLPMERLALPILGLYAVGVLFMVVGLSRGPRLLTLTGAGLLALGLGGYLTLFFHAVIRARGRRLLRMCLVGAGLALVVTVALGVSLAVNLRTDHLGALRFHVVGVHLHVALLGWILLTVVGVGRQLLPMFLLSHGHDERGFQVAAFALLAGVTALALGYRWTWPPFLWAVHLVLAVGVGALLIQVRQVYKARRRPSVDAGMALAGTGMVLLGLGLALSPIFHLWGGTRPGVATSYGILLFPGAVTLFVLGIGMKIFPFLAWLHRWGGRAAREKVPNVADLLPGRALWAVTGLLVAGTVGLAAAPLVGSEILARGAALVYASGSLLAAGLLLPLFRNPWTVAPASANDETTGPEIVIGRRARRNPPVSGVPTSSTTSPPTASSPSAPAPSVPSPSAPSPFASSSSAPSSSASQPHSQEA